MLFRMRGDEGPLALAAHHEIFGGEFVDRLAHRALAHAIARGQVHLAGDGFAGLPLAGLQALQDQALDLLVQRAERGRRLRFGHRSVSGGSVRLGHGRCAKAC
jgi:hypothetical protein